MEMFCVRESIKTHTGVLPAHSRFGGWVGGRGRGCCLWEEEVLAGCATFHFCKKRDLKQIWQNVNTCLIQAVGDIQSVTLLTLPFVCLK